MKIKLAFLFLSLPFFLIAQKLQEIPPTGGGEHFFQKGECLTPAERANIEAKLAENIKMLKSQGKLVENKSAIVSFDWPLRAVPELNFNNYYALTNYVDQDPSGVILDYNCGNRSYDGHYGTDIITWPFPWYIYDNDYVEVIAGEAGTIIWKQDGNDDDHCSCFGFWNAVYVQHIDGSVAFYGHLKKNSLTTKSVGASVAKGEYLGVVASSGCSTDPHLHWEIYKQTPYNMSNLIDPYSGTCNSLNTQSWWATQKPYRESTLNAIFTHYADPEMGCPGVNEDPHFSNAFLEGALARFGTYFQDQLVGHVSTMNIKRPSGATWQTWSFSSPSTYSASWWYWSWFMPFGDYGTWTFEVTYEGQTLTHEFVVYGPQAPACTNLTSPLNGATGVDVNADLTWSTPVTNPATGFKLTVGTSPGGTDIVNNEDVGLVNTYDPGTFPSGATIYVTITPYNPSGDAIGCIEESFSVAGALPACTFLGSPANGATGVDVDDDLSWAIIPDATGYKLSMGTSSGSTDLLNQMDVGFVTSYDPGTMPYNSNIYVTITPYNTNGDALACPEESFLAEVCTQNHTVNWLGITGDWNDKNNWDAGYVPSPCSYVVIPSGSVNIPAGIIAYAKTLDVQLGAIFDVPISAELIVE